MCGIIGYAGKDKAIEVVIHGLKNLEYRGYDSAGITYLSKNKFEIVKSVGKIKNLEEKLDLNEKSNLAIGHTRWATHGIPSIGNSHPHSVGDVVIVHNGIIENYHKLKSELIDFGYEFKSDTDTEVIAALLDKIYKELNDKLKTIKKVSKLLTGSYALGIIFLDDKENIYTIRKDSPRIIGVGKHENFIASDVPAILEYTNKYILLEEKEIACISNSNIVIYDNNLKVIQKDIDEFEGTKETVMKNGYEHFMLKEINDEPFVISETFKQFINDDITDILDNMTDFSKYNKIDIVACGSAYHAGLIGKYLLEEIAGLETRVELASEYRYKKNFNDEKTLTILVSQSGETADTIAALRKAKEVGDTLGIINVVSSTIARESKIVIYIKAGTEVSVATTKAYSCQVLVLSLIALNIKLSKNEISEIERKGIFKDLNDLPNLIKDLILRKEEFDNISKQIYKHKDIFFIGRSIDYYLCMEGSLKLKEISYIHSEAYAAGELKHGTISLIEEGTPVIGIITNESLFEKTMSNIKEVKARGAKVFILITEDLYDKCSEVFYDEVIILPRINVLFQSILTVVPLQLIAYEVARLKGESIDQPRNLAKSVTVE